MREKRERAFILKKKKEKSEVELQTNLTTFITTLLKTHISDMVNAMYYYVNL